MEAEDGGVALAEMGGGLALLEVDREVAAVPKLNKRC